MDSRIPKPRNDLEIIPVQSSGRRMFVVRDTWGLISEPVGLSEEMMVVLGLLSRGLSKRELAVALTRRYGGTIVMDEDVDRLVAKLDDALLLETARVQEARLELVRQWTRTSIRAPALAGQAYPANMHELHKFLDDILRPAVATTKPSGELRALAVPHIDLKVGRRVYAAGYSVMRQCAPQRVLVLGTGHSMGDDLVCLTEKDFETPLGRIETERDAVRRLRTAAGSLAAPDDLAHRREHSIEIQLVFLQHLLPGCNFKLIPVLFGSLEPHLARCAELSAIPGMNELLETLREMAGQPNTLTVAGVDLAHIGPKFGDPLPAVEIERHAIQEDKKLLQAICALDSQSYWNHLRAVDNRYHVCGAAALGCLIAILPSTRGRVLDYQIWHEQPTQSAVSFAAVSFERLDSK